LKDWFELIKLFMKEDHIETSKFNIYYRETMNNSKTINWIDYVDKKLYCIILWLSILYNDSKEVIIML